MAWVRVSLQEGVRPLWWLHLLNHLPSIGPTLSRGGSVKPRRARICDSAEDQLRRATSWLAVWAPRPCEPQVKKHERSARALARRASARFPGGFCVNVLSQSSCSPGAGSADQLPSARAWAALRSVVVLERCLAASPSNPDTEIPFQHWWPVLEGAALSGLCERLGVWGQGSPFRTGPPARRGERKGSLKGKKNRWTSRAWFGKKQCKFVVL